MDSNEVLREWARRSGEYSPRYYAYYGPDETSESIRGRLDAAVDRDASILELGCSSGRHLAHLRGHGYEDLHGIEINGDAFDVMADNYPGLAASGTFHADSIENVVADFDDGRFDAVFSVETLQHLHPENEWVFGELRRIAGDLLVTVENEGSGESTVNYVDDELPLYFRDWNRVFTDLGLVEVASEPVGRDTLRAFRPEEK